MGFIILDDKQLEKLLIQAYEEGWNGSKELAENSAEDIIKNFKNERKKSKNISESLYVSWKLANENPYKNYIYSTNSGTWGHSISNTASTSSSSDVDLSEY